MTGEPLVRFAAAGGEYAFRAAEVRQIVRVERMREAAAADGRAGTIELFGSAVPVYALDRVLGPQAARPAHASAQHIVVTGPDGGLAGWLVDRVVRTPLRGDDRVAPLPAIVGAPATRWFTSLVRIDRTSLLVVAPALADPAGAPRPCTAVRTPATAPGGTPAARYAAPVLIFGTPALPPAGVPRFALSCRRIVAVAQEMALTAVPGSARHIAGVSWWRDAVVPVIDFRGRGALDGGGKRRCIVARYGEGPGAGYVGLPVDADISMHRPRDEDRPAAGVSCPAFAAGVFDVGREQPIALLDLDALLDLGDVA